MSTKHTTDTSQQNTYAPGALDRYNQASGAGVNALMDFVKNPDKLRTFQMQQANNTIGQIGNRMNSNVLNNLHMMGLNTGQQNPFIAAQIARNSRAVGNMQGNAFLQTLFNADQRKMQGAYGLMSYQPLQTGSNSHQVEQTSGLGTWLPQLAGAAIGGLSSAFTGGLGGGAGSLFGGTGVGSLASATNLPVGSFQPMPNVFAGYQPAMPSFGGGGL